jgi:hypothetical protein
VALAVLSVAAVGAARLFGAAALMASRARTQTSATTLAMQKLDELRALRWRAVATPSSSPATDTETRLSLASPAAGGQGLAVSPADSLDRNVAGYVDYLDRLGQWVGTGSAIPAEAMFIRRWNVASWPGDESNTLILRVLVTNSAVERTRSAGSPRGRLLGESLLVGIRTRVSQ